MSGTTAADAVGHDELATLRVVALDSGLTGEVKVSCAGLGERLDASSQTASRRLQRLDDAGLLAREVTGDGQWVTVTDAGEAALRREYEQYRRIFEEPTSVELRGHVTSGMGEGRHYISLPGYMEQFRDRLGYEPFPGTLNVELAEESLRRRAGMEAVEAVAIDGWQDEDRTFGPASCYPATLVADGGRYETVHAIVPERTHHDESQLELIAPDRLRDALELEDDEELEVHVGA